MPASSVAGPALVVSPAPKAVAQPSPGSVTVTSNAPVPLLQAPVAAPIKIEPTSTPVVAVSTVEPGEIRRRLPPEPPAGGVPFDDMLHDLEEIILPGITHWQSPSFFAFFPANCSGPSILGELLAAGLGVQGMSWATSPAGTGRGRPGCPVTGQGQRRRGIKALWRRTTFGGLTAYCTRGKGGTRSRFWAHESWLSPLDRPIRGIKSRG